MMNSKMVTKNIVVRLQDDMNKDDGDHDTEMDFQEPEHL